MDGKLTFCRWIKGFYEGSQAHVGEIMAIKALMKRAAIRQGAGVGSDLTAGQALVSGAREYLRGRVHLVARRTKLRPPKLATGIVGLLWIVAAGCATAATPTDGAYAPTIDPADFVGVVNNPYFPLTPGTTYISEGETSEGREQIEEEVTSQTKQILGVTCVVVHSTALLDGELVEETNDWYAQDKDGNVWYFGEDTKEYENGQVVSTEGSWEAGVDGAQPGMIMQADPRVGDSYRQEYYAGHAEDMAEVLSRSESVSVPFGSFENVLKTKEWSALEPSVVEEKYYAEGVGWVRETIVQGGSGSVELVDVLVGR